MSTEHKDERAIFKAAFKMTSQTERAAYLKQACGSDVELLARIEALLKAYEEAGDFLEVPAFGADVTLDTSPLTEGPGTIIGRYKLLEQIGEGGFGAVYMAEQQEPIRRRVALKIIKLGMDTKQVITRFEVERQALAMMDHPNIAKVLDAGATETGRPYFVMELVKGIPITEYCDKNNLDTRQRLELFIDVCKAVQHAHQKGIIHRDIKPSNVMITLHDGKPVPKVIDFGIAKATSQQLTEKTLFTRYAQMIGTPEYMSPEQAEMSWLDIDTRTDIYSLGVLLYELLTGATPFDAKELREAGYAEMQRIIRETEPLKPSTKLSTMGDALTDVAKHRLTNPDLLPKLVRGDLDWIAMKSLEKDRTRRYETANELAMDIQRHLSDEPVVAGAPSTLYKINKFVRRNRVKVITVAIVATVLVVGLIISMTMYLQKKHALDALAKLETQVEADRSLSTVQKLYAEGRYQAALAEIETHLQRKKVGPKAKLLHAHLLFELDRFGDAAAELEKLLTEQPDIAGTAHYLLARIFIGSDPNKSEKYRQLAESLLPQTAEAYSLRGMTADTPEKTIEWLSRALELDPGHYPSRKARAFAYYAMNDYQKMEQDVEALIVIRPKDSLGYALRAIVRRQTGKLEDAIKDHNYAIKICDVKQELVNLYDQRRETYIRMGNNKAVLEDAQMCVKLQPEEFTYNFNVGTALVSLGQYDAVREMYHQSVEMGDNKWPIRAESMRYVFSVLGVGQPFELPADIALEEPFSAMQEAVGYYRTLEKKAVCLIPSLSNQPSLSPDGKKLAYNRTGEFTWQSKTSGTGAPVIYESSGIEILDIDSGKTRLLVSSGKDPVWSPDGRYIAFVRWPKLGAYSAEEIWLIPATGGEPRRLAKGYWPSWASDSKRVYFSSRPDRMLCSISIDDHSAQPKQLISYPVSYPGVSPDEKYVAYAKDNELLIMEMSTGNVVTKWTAPCPENGMLVRWSPDGKEIFIGGYLNSDLGLWCFDVQRKEAWQIFDAPVMRGSLSLDRSRIAVDLRFPFGGIWLAKLDHNIPTYQSLAPVFTREEFLRRKCEQYTRALKNNALDWSSYYYAIRLIDNLTSQGMEYYKKGDYKEALTMLAGANSLYHVAYNKSRPSETAFIAMSLFQLGRKQEAQASLEQLRGMFEDEQHTSAEYYLDEAEQLFAGKDTKVYSAWGCIKAGKLDEAAQVVEELRLLKDPNNAGQIDSVIKGLARAYYNRGRIAIYGGGSYAETIDYYETSVRLDTAYAKAFSDLAYLQAACPAPEFRNPGKAIENATKACEMTNWKNYRYVSTLAAVYAEVGDFASAVKRQKEAIGLLPKDKSTEWQANYETRLKLYESGKPYHKSNICSFSTGEMVAWWKLDEAKDGSVVDSSGNNLHGKLIGDAKIISDPERGNVLSLDGNGDYVDCGNNPAFDITDKITVTAWIKINAVNKDWQPIIAKGDSAWRLSSVRNETRIHFAVTNGPPEWNVNGNTFIPTNQWHYVCATYDGTNVRLYIDGVEDSASPVFYTGGITANKYPVCIGKNAEWTVPPYWDGLIDDVRIYSYALSEAEVKALYKSKNPPIKKE